MKILKVLLLFIGLNFIAGCSSSDDYTTQFKPETRFYGGWNCINSMGVEGAEIILDMNVSYVRNGNYSSAGKLIIDILNLPKVEYWISTSGSWAYKNGYLIETANEVIIKNIKNPEYDNLLDLQSMFPQNSSESSEVLQITNTFFKARTESDGIIFTCNKV